ncbi:MAG: DUF6492 family protein [Bacteroidota bacterium]
MKAKLRHWLNPLAIYYYIRHVQIIKSQAVYFQSREFLFNIFKINYKSYQFFIEPGIHSATPLDVVIPVIEKDLDILPHVIAGVRRYLKHPLGNIYIVAPNSEKIINEASKGGAVFVNENDVCAVSKQDINFVVNGKDRSGWIYQQILKLNFDKIVAEENFLVIDADTVFVSNMCFEKRGRHYFDFSDEYHAPYHEAYKILTGYDRSMPVSFVSHYMLFNKQKLQQLKQHIEVNTGKPLLEAIKSIKERVLDYSSFSEYETYANFCIHKFPKQHTIRYWFNKSCRQGDIIDIKILREKSKNLWKSLSFHSHSN